MNDRTQNTFMLDTVLVPTLRRGNGGFLRRSVGTSTFLMSFTSVKKPRAMAVAGLLLLGAIGCGPKLYPARGTVTYPDGSPVTEGLVVFESKDQEKTTTARGEIRSDGSFELATFKPGDGARPGKYRVLVAPKFDPNAVDRPSKKPPFHSRYGEFKTSGLELDVTAAGPNEFPIKVTR
jgi:hypothetical protein